MGHLKKYQTNIPLWGLEVDLFYINAFPKTAPGYRMVSEHLHEHYELVFNFSRISIQHTSGSRSYTSETPCVLFRAPYVLHSLNTQQSYTRTMLAFHPCILSEYSNVLELGKLSGYKECMIPRTEAQMEYIDQILSRMQRLWRRGKADKPWIGLLAELLHEVSAMLPDDAPDEPASPPYIHELLHYIVEHTDEKLSAQALAKHFTWGTASRPRISGQPWEFPYTNM